MLATVTKEKLTSAVDKVITAGVPGTSVYIIGKDAKELFSYATGKRGLESPEQMTTDNIFWIASCTKMITGIACMQLVEQGKMILDDVGFVKNICPELKNVKVLKDDGTLEDKKRGITLRILLTHTAGFGYAFFNHKLRQYNYPVGYDEFSGHMHDMLHPLVNQPGEKWEYGINVDWAGLMIERITRMSLNEYFHGYIFEPLGLKNISLFPTPQMKAKLAFMSQKSPDGTFTGQEPLLRLPLISDNDKEFVNSGGAGCFSSPQNYCQILATLLNNGISPATGAQILQTQTVDQMFTNQIPHLPSFGRTPIPDSKPLLTNAVSELYPQDGEPEQGWGLTFMLTISPTATGRNSGAVHWSGISNCYWWCDREGGVAGIVCSQILPYGDPDILGLWVEVEALVNEGLEASKEHSKISSHI